MTAKEQSPGAVPPRPSTPLFDPARRAWILSRYADVLAAFLESRLVIAGDRRDDQLRAATVDFLSPAKLGACRPQLLSRAKMIMQALPADRDVDLVQEFLRPWCTFVAVLVTGADPASGPRLTELASCLSAFTSATKKARAAAASELTRSLPDIPMAEGTFVALSQTLPCFLTNAWQALLQNPEQMRKLQSKPSLMPGAIEELLRYAGVADRLHRRATEDLSLGGAKISAGDEVILLIGSANRDPAQFADPDGLDIERKPVRQLGLGAGAHSCVAAALIRMGATAATAALAERINAASFRGSSVSAVRLPPYIE